MASTFVFAAGGFGARSEPVSDRSEQDLLSCWRSCSSGRGTGSEADGYHRLLPGILQRMLRSKVSFCDFMN